MTPIRPSAYPCLCAGRRKPADPCATQDHAPAERREGALCVAAQALFELGRAEEAFDLVLRYYPSGTPAAGTADFCATSLELCMQALAGKPIPSHPDLTPILPAAGTAGFSRVPPALLTLLCRLRLHLDKGDAAAAEQMMAGYVALACEETSRDAAMRGPDPVPLPLPANPRNGEPPKCWPARI